LRNANRSQQFAWPVPTLAAGPQRTPSRGLSLRFRASYSHSHADRTTTLSPSVVPQRWKWRSIRVRPAYSREQTSPPHRQTLVRGFLSLNDVARFNRAEGKVTKAAAADYAGVKRSARPPALPHPECRKQHHKQRTEPQPSSSNASNNQIMKHLSLTVVTREG